MRYVAGNALAMAQWLRVRDDLRTGRLLADVLLGSWQRLRSLYVVLRRLIFDLRCNRVADQFLRWKDLVRRSVIELSGHVALLLSIVLDVLGNVRFVLGNALNEFTSRWKNVLQVVLVFGGGRGMFRSAGSSQIGSRLLHQTALNGSWGKVSKVTANRRLWLRLRTRVVRESVHLLELLLLEEVVEGLVELRLWLLLLLLGLLRRLRVLLS